MIDRYTLPEMKKIWSESARYRYWLKVETAVCAEMVRLRMIPARDGRELLGGLAKLDRSGGVSADRVAEIEKTTKHDIIAFTTAVAEKVGPTSRFVHFGLTSSDVIDSALALQIQDAGALILSEVDGLLVILKKRALRHKRLATIGRSHGIFAEPTSFGLKFLGWYTEWKRNRVRLQRALEACAVGKLSGAVGVNSHWSPALEARILKRLALKREQVSTQVIPRDRHAEVMTTVALLGASMERVAVELRHLQRSEVGEVIEGFVAGQKGSSAMPHKRNPISSENLTGCARLLRAYANASVENVALWHERDISHSAVERVAMIDAFTLAHYAVARLKRVLTDLHVDEARVTRNLALAGDISFSGHLLLALVSRGVSREEAYAWVQSCALSALGADATPSAKGAVQGLAERAAGHPEIAKWLTKREISAFASLKYQLRNVDEIFKSALR